MPGADAADGLTTSALGRPDLSRMLAQHGLYVEALQGLKLDVTVLDPVPGHPDAYFVEDAAVITPALAVVTRPGALPRRAEAEAIAPVLGWFKRTAPIVAPGTLDGGDVLIVGERVFVGLTSRTNEAGIAQLADLLAPQGYATTAVEVGEGLHLKTFVNTLGDDRLILSEALAGHPAFAPYRKTVVDDDELYACNVLWINGTLLIPAGFPKTRNKLFAQGLPMVELEMSEPRKMDGGLTCLSLRF